MRLDNKMVMAGLWLTMVVGSVPANAQPVVGASPSRQELARRAAWETANPLYARAVAAAAIRNFGLAQELLKALSDEGNLSAKATLGKILSSGETTTDYPTAFRLFSEAAAGGEVTGQFNIGVFYRDGKVVGKNAAVAFLWFAAAAEQDFAPAQNALSILYERGEGVAKNDERAAYWGMKAAQSGNARYQDRLGRLYEGGIGLPKDYGLAFHWYEKAAGQYNSSGQFNLARLYELGAGTAVNYDKAFGLYMASAKQGLPVSELAVARSYQYGLGTAQRMQKPWNGFARRLTMAWLKRSSTSDRYSPTASS